MKYLVFFIFVFLFQTGLSQVKNEIPFIHHLINKGYYQEAIYLIEGNAITYNKPQQDSLNYYHGWAYYSLKRLEESTASLLKVGGNSPFYRKSHFFAGYNQIYLGNYKTADEILNQIMIQSDAHLSLLNFELSGLNHLQGNWQLAREQLKKVNPESAILRQPVLVLEEIFEDHKNHRSKSPVLAGIMSGIIPGSGKIYAGKTGSGIASMIGTIGFGLIAWENYNKLGMANAKTIIFGSIFAMNYVSNIYGSVISVKIIENEYKNNLHQQILFQLHIPLRNFFE